MRASKLAAICLLRKTTDLENDQISAIKVFTRLINKKYSFMFTFAFLPVNELDYLLPEAFCSINICN